MKDSEKYVSVAKVKDKLRYFFRDYGIGGLIQVNAIKAINNIKLADVAPVVHGRWIEVYENNLSCECLYCSMCGYREFEERTYCAHCGAKMDESEDNDNE